MRSSGPAVNCSSPRSSASKSSFAASSMSIRSSFVAGSATEPMAELQGVPAPAVNIRRARVHIDLADSRAAASSGSVSQASGTEPASSGTSSAARSEHPDLPSDISPSAACLSGVSAPDASPSSRLTPSLSVLSEGAAQGGSKVGMPT